MIDDELRDKVFSEIAAQIPLHDSWRGHLGASIIADNCDRKAYYTFYWCSHRRRASGPDPETGRMAMLLERGTREEEPVIASLRVAGITISDYKDVRRKRQWNFKDEANPAFAGSCDGYGMLSDNTPFILEIKTASRKNFRKFKKKGLLLANARYFGQAQSYMRWSIQAGRPVDKTLFVIVQKDDDDRHYEWIKYDPAFARELAIKADRVLSASGPSELLRIANDPSYYECSYCEHRSVCHEGAAPAKNCRTCKYSEMKQFPKSGRVSWRCRSKESIKKNTQLSLSDARLGCEHWRVGNDVISNRCAS